MASLLRLADGRRAALRPAFAQHSARNLPHIWSIHTHITLQTRATYLTFGAFSLTNSSKREKPTSHLEHSHTHYPPNTGKLSRIWRAWFNVIAAEHNCKAYYSAAVSSVVAPESAPASAEASSLASPESCASPLNFAKQASLSATTALSKP